jgi:hypothetical protein
MLIILEQCVFIILLTHLFLSSVAGNNNSNQIAGHTSRAFSKLLLLFGDLIYTRLFNVINNTDKI